MADLCELGHGLAAPVAAALIRARAALAGVAGEAVEAVAHARRALAETETETETEAETETEIDAHRGSFLLVVNQRRSSYTHTRSIAVTLCGSRGDHRLLTHSNGIFLHTTSRATTSQMPRVRAHRGYSSWLRRDLLAR